MKVSAKYWVGIIAILLLVMWLGARKLNADGIWFDEWWSLYVAGADVFNVSRSVGDIWQRIINEDIRQGVFYPLALAGWGSVVGWTEFATRALSLLAGLVALAGVFRLGRALGGHPLVGLGAVALLGTSVWFIAFLHEMRVYMLLVMFTVLLLLFYQRITQWRREPHLVDYAALAVVTGLLVNTHYFAIIVVGVVGLWHLSQLLTARPTRRWWRVLGAWLVSGLLLIPWLVNIQRAAELARNEPRVQPDINLMFQMAADTFSAFSNTSVALLAVLLAFSLLARRARPLWLMAGLLLALNLATYYIFSLNELRYNMTMLPLLAVLAGFGVYELAKRRVPALLIVSIWAFAGLAVEGNFQVERMIQRWPGQPIREMAEVLKTQAAPEDVIVNLIGDDDRPSLASHPMVYYMGDFGARIEVVENTTYPGTQIFAARVREAVGDASRLWLVNDRRWASSQWSLIEYLLNELDLYHCATAADTPDMRIWGFARINDDAPAWRYREDIRLSPANTHIQDGLLHTWLAYQIADAVPPDTYSVGIFLMDAAGQVRGQYDMGLPAVGRSCHAAEMPVSGLPAGEYTLRAAIYNWQTGERLISSAPDGNEADLPTIETVAIPAN